MSRKALMLILAAAVMLVPVILLFLFVQEHIVKAIAVGPLKG